MKFGLPVAPISGCLILSLGHCSAFRVGVESVLASTDLSLFKCTVNKELQTLTTPYSKVLCE